MALYRKFVKHYKKHKDGRNGKHGPLDCCQMGAGCPFHHMNRCFSFILLYLALLLPCTASPAPAVALYYGPITPLDELAAFDIAVVDPDHGARPNDFRAPGRELYAYVAIGEVYPTRAYFSAIPPDAFLAENADWGSRIIDLARPDWPAFVAERIVAPLWERGYRGFFLDTLDSYRRATRFDEQAQQAGLVAVIETLHRRFPGIQLILNRGFEMVPRVRDKVAMVAAESLFRGWDAGRKRYVEVPPADRDWLLGQLQKVRDEYGIPVLSIDYVDPNDRALTRATAERIQALNIVPWVTDGGLQTLGIGQREVMPRRIAVLYDSRATPAINYTLVHRFLQMPINHLGYLAEYIDVNEPLPELMPGRYAGIAVWINGGEAHPKALGDWVQRQIAHGLPVAVLGGPAFLVLDAAAQRRLGLAGEAPPSGRMRVALADPAFKGEAPLLPERQETHAVRLTGAGRPLIELNDAKDRRYTVAALTPWGGFALSPFVLDEISEADQFRWLIDPFAFLTAALRLPDMPVPDTTTENGRRLLTAHIDGDGFPSRAELPGTPLAGRALLDHILVRYRIPHAVSVIESEVSPQGLYPQLAPEMEAIAKQIFALPYVEIATHSYSHPFRWNNAVRHGIFKDAEGETYNLAIPGYTMDLTREIVGSTNYINEHLAPPGKKVKLMLWTGDTAPSTEALRITYEAGLLNLNGGDTRITRHNPSVTAVAPLGIRKEGYQQVYAPVTNENLYTNLWTGPFYGFRRVIETFEMTEAPRRLEPIGIYYHTYSATKRASLDALHTVYQWALAQLPHPVFATDFVRKVLDFDKTVIAREAAGWRIRTGDSLRTVRLPDRQGPPDLNASTGIAGFREGREGRYVHLTGGDALLSVTPSTSPRRPFLSEANGRLDSWKRQNDVLRFTLKGHLPLEFTLADARRCRLTADGQPVPTRPRGDNTLTVHLNHAAATIEARCGER